MTLSFTRIWLQSLLVTGIRLTKQAYKANRARIGYGIPGVARKRGSVYRLGIHSGFFASSEASDVGSSLRELQEAGYITNNVIYYLSFTRLATMRLILGFIYILMV